jgi:hypothetical protein
MLVRIEVFLLAAGMTAFGIWMLCLVVQAIRTGETQARNYGHLVRETDPLDFFLVTGARLFAGLLCLVGACIITFR